METLSHEDLQKAINNTLTHYRALELDEGPVIGQLEKHLEALLSEQRSRLSVTHQVSSHDKEIAEGQRQMIAGRIASPGQQH